MTQHTEIPMARGYFADPDGDIYSASGWRGAAYRRLKWDLDDDGYPSVRVIIRGKRKRVSVHRLMANAFLPSRPSPQHEVRHLDGNKLNRAASNLDWGTRADNAADRDVHGRTSRGTPHSLAIKAGLARRLA